MTFYKGEHNLTNEDILYKYLDRFPHSITRMNMDFDDKELIERMKWALATDKPLTDDDLGIPPDALI